MLLSILPSAEDTISHREMLAATFIEKNGPDWPTSGVPPSAEGLVEFVTVDSRTANVEQTFLLTGDKAWIDLKKAWEMDSIKNP